MSMTTPSHKDQCSHTSCIMLREKRDRRLARRCAFCRQWRQCLQQCLQPRERRLEFVRQRSSLMSTHEKERQLSRRRAEYRERRTTFQQQSNSQQLQRRQFPNSDAGHIFQIEVKNAHFSGTADWSNLPHDVWMLIAQKFGLLRDLSLFASVSVQWRDVAKQVRGNFLSRPPLLMLPFKEGTHTRDFYDLSTNSVYNINLPELDDQWICGASNGWLVTLDRDLKIELLNPYSKTKLQLPNHPAIVDFPERVHPTYRLCYMHKVILTESPNSIQACLVVFLVSTLKRLAICRVGDDKWTDIETELNRYYTDITWYKGKLLAIGKCAPLVILDVGEDFKATMINAPDYPLIDTDALCKKYLVESAGDLLLVVRLSRVVSGSLAVKTFRFDVYKLNERMQGWTKVENLGDQSIFVGGSHSTSAKVCGISGFRSNCIYYLEDFAVFGYRKGCQFDCGLFCLADGHTKPLPEEVLSFWSAPGFWCMQSL